MKGIWHFCFNGGNPPFWNLEDVLSLEGTLRKQNPMGSIWQSFHFIVLGKGFDAFKITILHRPFWNLENVLSPGGTLQSRARRWSNCFYFPFYWCRKRYWGFKIHLGTGLFWNLENVLSPKGSNWILLIFYWCKKRYWGFQNPNLKSRFFVIYQRDIAHKPPKFDGLCKITRAQI